MGKYYRDSNWSDSYSVDSVQLDQLKVVSWVASIANGKLSLSWSMNHSNQNTYSYFNSQNTKVNIVKSPSVTMVVNAADNILVYISATSPYYKPLENYAIKLPTHPKYGISGDGIIGLKIGVEGQEVIEVTDKTVTFNIR